MFNVVVDTENTGKQLLQKGGLQRRVTIIPLNKIQSHPVSQRTHDAAVNLVRLQPISHISFIVYFFMPRKYVILNLQVGKGNAAVALSLVGYDQELQVCFQTANLIFIFSFIHLFLSWHLLLGIHYC